MGELLDYICVLDFEANCMRKGIPTPQEIIEFPVLLVHASSGNLEGIFHTYVKPDVHPKISQFCTQLTGITRAMVNQGISLDETLIAHQAWLDSHNLIPAWQTKTKPEQKTFLYLTCGDWDFQTCLSKQLAYHNKELPLFAERWINIKHIFPAVLELRTRCPGMVGMLDILGLKLVGRHHSGIDDCRNIARIVQKLIQAGWKPTSECFTGVASGQIGQSQQLISV